MYKKSLPLLIIIFTWTSLLSAQENEQHNPQTVDLGTPLTVKELNSVCDNFEKKAKADVSNLFDLDARQNPKVFLKKFDDVLSPRFDLFSQLRALSNLSDNKQLKKAASNCFYPVFTFGQSLDADFQLAQKFQSLDTTDLGQGDRTFIKYWMQKFKKNGAFLPPKERKVLQELKAIEAELLIQFANNSTSPVLPLTISESHTSGLPKGFLDTLERDSSDNFILPVNYSNRDIVMGNAREEQLRKSFYLARSNQGAEKGKGVLTELLGVRWKIAKALGYNNYADLIAEGTMPRSVNNVENMLNEITGVVNPLVQQRYHLLQSLKQKEIGKNSPLFPWDTTYFGKQLDLKIEMKDPYEVSKYFHKDKVINATIVILSQLFQVELKPLAVETWHPEAKAYAVINKGNNLGTIVLDFGSRQTGFSGFAGALRSGTVDRLPVSYATLNFSGEYLSMREVKTILHETGHAFEHILNSNINYSAFWFDNNFEVSETPSQMLENFLWDYDVIKKHATNDTGEPIPEPLFNLLKVQNDKNRAQALYRGVVRSRISLMLHQYDPQSMTLPEKFAEIMGLHDLLGYHGEQSYASFSHLGGYSSRYYTYLWSEAMATDLFHRFKTEGLFNPQTGQEYRDIVLGNWSRQSPTEAMETFLGRSPNIANFMKSLPSSQ